MSYLTEFPDYDGDFYIPDGWADNSWHNDTMPRAMLLKEIDGNTIEYSIWQDYVDVDKREIDSQDRYFFDITVNNILVYSYNTDKLDRIKKLIKGIAFFV